MLAVLAVLVVLVLVLVLLPLKIHRASSSALLLLSLLSRGATVLPHPLPPAVASTTPANMFPAWRSVLSRRFATASAALATAATNGTRTNRASLLRAEEGGVTPGGACVRRPVGPDQAEAADPASSIRTRRQAGAGLVYSCLVVAYARSLRARGFPCVLVSMCF